MALTYPLTTADFFDILRVEEITLSLSNPQEYSRFGDGSVVKASLGAPLWSGYLKTTLHTHAHQSKIEGLMSVLDRPGASFLCRDPRYKAPLSDPSGAILGVSTPTIHSIDPNTKQLKLSGLPSGYVLTAGDFLSFEYGSNPVRYAFHRVVVGGAAGSSGVTTNIEVVPQIRSGATASTPVRLIAPFFKAVMMPAPSWGVGRAGFTNGVSFEFIQTLR